MSSAFESEVYAERQRLPGVSVNPIRLLQYALWNQGKAGGEIPPVSFTLEYRSDVDTSQWWTFRWGESFVSAKDLEVCLFRAAVMMRRDDSRAKKYAGMTDKACLVCGQPSTGLYQDRADFPTCGGRKCELKMQGGIDAHEKGCNR